MKKWSTTVAAKSKQKKMALKNQLTLHVYAKHLVQCFRVTSVRRWCFSLLTTVAKNYTTERSLLWNYANLQNRHVQMHRRPSFRGPLSYFQNLRAQILARFQRTSQSYLQFVIRILQGHNQQQSHSHLTLYLQAEAVIEQYLLGWLRIHSPKVWSEWEETKGSRE